MSDARVEAYSRALFEVAQAEGNLSVVEDELFRMARAIESSEQLRGILTEADAQATAILADGRARLIKEVAELEAKAAADLAAARGRSGEELRGEIARLSSAATSKAVAASLDERAQQELIESFIKSVGAAK